MESRAVQDDEERRHLRSPDPPIHHRAGASAAHAWPTVDGPLGPSEDQSVAYARSFYLWGFCLLPFLWALNCFYFWPVLRRSLPSSASASVSFHRIRHYVVRSAVGFAVFAVLLTTWALTFSIGGERLFGPGWKDLVMYNVADKLGLTGWM